jgi:hypothetical protein
MFIMYPIGSPITYNFFGWVDCAFICGPNMVGLGVFLWCPRIGIVPKDEGGLYLIDVAIQGYILVSK